ncbi:hypothetical protein C2G38_2144686 [Gigaspora rosea]|uniref:Uncharacterized protein n=1 Tax=Gigaspora rosea TaxID=44941 RepID=A0A397UTL0_9GLOM|nr:hypothetical protein C2G38_2144686 [Gigaspora rosea]
MNIYKILGFAIDLLTIVIISLSNYGEAYNFSEYGNSTMIRQFDDEKLLLFTNNNVNLLHLIYPNGSIVPINYEDSINFNNNSEWIFGNYIPLTENHILFVYFNRKESLTKESLTDLSMHGTIINLQGEIITKDMVMVRHLNGSSSWYYSISTSDDGFSRSFLITYQVMNHLNWTIYTYSDDGNVTQISYGSIRPPVDNFFFDSHLTITTYDGRYAIVYAIRSYKKTNGGLVNSVYAHFINVGEDQTSGEHLLFQDDIKYLISLGGCARGFDAFNIQSNGCTFQKFLINFAVTPITFEYITIIVTFSSSGTVINRDSISNELTDHISAQPLPYGGFISIDEIGHSSQVNVYNSNYTSSYKIFEVSNETIVDYGIYSNNTLWLTYGNKTANRKLIMLDVERFSNDSSTQVLLRLNPYGTKYFLSCDQANKTQLLNDMVQQIKQSIPLNDDRLKITHNVQLHPSDSTKLLIEFSVDKAIDPSKEPSVNDIINDLNDIIMNKHISALSDKNSMIFFDDQYGFQPKPNLWMEIRYKLLILLIAVIILFVIYLLAKRRNQKGQNFIIFKISLIIVGLILDFSFIIMNGNDVPSLYIPRLDFFSALVSENFKRWILYGTACHLFIKNIPQLVIQIIYQRSVIMYTSIPLLTLVVSAIILSINILTSIYNVWINNNVKKKVENAEQRSSLLFTET